MFFVFVFFAFKIIISASAQQLVYRGMVNLKDPFLLIRKNNPWNGSIGGFLSCYLSGP